DWLAHPPEDPWWDSLDLRDKYHRTDAAVLNFSGWYDEAYGPEGAATNFSGLMASRTTWDDPRIRLVIGPWAHGVPSTGDSSVGDRDFGPQGVVDYDELVLRWMDRYVRGSENGVEFEPRVRAFLMGRNAWVESNSWPIPGGNDLVLYLDGTALPGRPSLLSRTAPGGNGSRSSFVSDPAQPVRDPYPPNSGAHDYAGLLGRSDVLAWETPPLQSDVSIMGRIEAVLYVSCDAPDADIWVKLLDVGPDGRAMSLMSPGLDVLRMSYRDPAKPRLLEPGRVYEIRLGNLMTGNTFRKGHRIRIQLSGSFFPNFSRNLHTGKRETESGEMRRAQVTLHHHPGAPSRIRLPSLEP
ncbi:MAG: CocE/NonD family hydrolase, partial [Acidobacteriota bacterium]